MTVRIIYISKGDRNIVGSIVYKDNNSIMSSNNTNDNQPLNASDVDALLEKEKLRNKGDVWIKLDKTMRIQRLNDYADTYGKENDMSSKDTRLLRNFFKNCLRCCIIGCCHKTFLWAFIDQPLFCFFSVPGKY